MKILHRENCTWKLPLTRNFSVFHWNVSLALKWKGTTTSPLILRRLDFEIPVCSNYAGAKRQGFESNWFNSVKDNIFSSFRLVVALLNAVNCNIQPVYWEILKVLARKKKYFDSLFRWHITNNHMISNIKFTITKTQSTPSLDW